jgi:hypothetical protein
MHKINPNKSSSAWSHQLLEPLQFADFFGQRDETVVASEEHFELFEMTETWWNHRQQVSTVNNNRTTKHHQRVNHELNATWRYVTS